MSKNIDMDFLREEYFHLQTAVEAFDEKSLTIKAWSVTLSMAGIGVAFLEKESLIFLLASGSAFLFWLIETSWKTFQQANYLRLRKIENFMEGKIDPDEFQVPDITRSWSVGWKQTKFLNVMRWPHVYLPHGVTVVFGLALWLIDWKIKLI